MVGKTFHPMSKTKRNIELTQVTQWNDGKAARVEDYLAAEETQEQPSRVNDQREAAEIEKSFVAAHARAGAPRKNKVSDLAITIHHSQGILRPRSGLAQRSGGS
jgi:hypothetical protein